MKRLLTILLLLALSPIDGMCSRNTSVSSNANQTVTVTVTETTKQKPVKKLSKKDIIRNVRDLIVGIGMLVGLYYVAASLRPTRYYYQPYQPICTTYCDYYYCDTYCY